MSEVIRKRFMTPFSNPRYETLRRKSYLPKYMPPFQYCFLDDEGQLFIMTFEKEDNSREYIYGIFNIKGIFIGRVRLNN